MVDDAAKRRRLMELLGPLHDRARATARRLCRSHADGDDLFHEAVLRALDRLDDLRDDGKFRSWFYAVLLNTHRAHHRLSFWRRLVPLEDTSEPHADRSGGADAQLESARRMARALATLAPPEREAIVLFELDGFSLDEVAELQQSSLPAVKSRLVRARARLRRHYERGEAEWTRIAGSKPI